MKNSYKPKPQRLRRQAFDIVTTYAPLLEAPAFELPDFDYNSFSSFLPQTTAPALYRDFPETVPTRLPTTAAEINNIAMQQFTIPFLDNIDPTTVASVRFDDNFAPTEAATPLPQTIPTELPTTQAFQPTVEAEFQTIPTEIPSTAVNFDSFQLEPQTTVSSAGSQNLDKTTSPVFYEAPVFTQPEMFKESTVVPDISDLLENSPMFTSPSPVQTLANLNFPENNEIDSYYDYPIGTVPAVEVTTTPAQPEFSTQASLLPKTTAPDLDSFLLKTKTTAASVKFTEPDREIDPFSFSNILQTYPPTTIEPTAPYRPRQTTVAITDAAEQIFSQPYAPTTQVPEMPIFSTAPASLEIFQTPQSSDQLVRNNFSKISRHFMVSVSLSSSKNLHFHNFSYDFHPISMCMFFFLFYVQCVT